jgi:HD-like signal output (HDOD) protein
MKQLARILSTDQALTAKVLRMANSAYYGLRGKVGSVRHAAILLGNHRLAEVITMAGSSQLLDRELTGYEMAPKTLWRHSMAVAFGARRLVMKKNSNLENDAFISGLIHDVGKIILSKYVAERMRAFRGRLKTEVLDFTRVEQEILGFDHTSIAFQACRKWGLPDQLGVAVRHHHHPSRSDAPILAAAVHLADAMALMSGIAVGFDGLLYGMEEGAAEILGVTEMDLLNAMAEMMDAVEKVESRTLGGV